MSPIQIVSILFPHVLWTMGKGTKAGCVPPDKYCYYIIVSIRNDSSGVIPSITSITSIIVLLSLLTKAGCVPPERLVSCGGARRLDRRGAQYNIVSCNIIEYDILDSLRGSSVKIGTIQRRLAWPLRKDDTHKSRS